MNEYRKTASWEYLAIEDMSTEHIINTINYIKNSYDDTRLEYLAWNDSKWFKERDERIHNQYQAMHNELVVRLAKKFII